MKNMMKKKIHVYIAYNLLTVKLGSLSNNLELSVNLKDTL